MNTEDLPFNLRHLRWPIRYSYGPDTPSNEKKAITEQLIQDLASALRLILAERPQVLQSTPFIASDVTPQRFAEMAKTHELLIDGPLGDLPPYELPS